MAVTASSTEAGPSPALRSARPAARPFASLFGARLAAPRRRTHSRSPRCSTFPYRFAKGHVGLFAGSLEAAWAGQRYFLPHPDGIVVGTDYQARQRQATVDHDVLTAWRQEAVVQHHLGAKTKTETGSETESGTSRAKKPGPALLRPAPPFAALRQITCPVSDRLSIILPRKSASCLASRCGCRSGRTKPPRTLGVSTHGSRGASVPATVPRIFRADSCGLASPSAVADALAVQPDRAWLRELRRNPQS